MIFHHQANFDPGDICYFKFSFIGKKITYSSKQHKGKRKYIELKETNSNAVQKHQQMLYKKHQQFIVYLYYLYFQGNSTKMKK